MGLTPIALVCWYVVTQGSPVPIGDQWWDPVYIAVKTQAGILTLEDVFVLSWGHRPAITRLITVLATIATHYDAGSLRFASFILTLLNLGLTLLLLKPRQALIPISFFLSSILLFSLYNYSSWLDMYFSAWQQAMVFILLGLVALQRMRPGWPAFMLVVLCATAASFACASGLVAWISLPVAAAGMAEYRRRSYAMLWLLVLALFLSLYTSDYAVPHRVEQDSLSLDRALDHGLVSLMLYLFRFLAVRFNASHVMAICFTLICSIVLLLNWWQIMRSKDGAATAALWGSLAVYSIGVAALVLMARGPVVLSHYSPGSDGFFLAFIALSLLVLARRPRLHVAALNISLLVALVFWSVRTDVRTLRSLPDASTNRACDKLDKVLVNFPLFRDGSIRNCFEGEEQSAYHLAALRLSVFRNETPRLILPRTDAQVITDMPNRWLSVYVRDYMMAGLPRENLYSIAPVPGAWSSPARAFRSPYDRGEWSTDILPHPLQQTWTGAKELASDLSILILDKPLIWYLNTPETEANFPIVNEALAKLGYSATRFPIQEPRYAFARFGLWCFERRKSDT